MIRFAVSMEEELLREFDRYVRNSGFKNRSYAIRHIIRRVLEEESTTLESGDVFGTITILYDHSQGDVGKKITHIQHHYHDEIKSTVHVHADEEMCLEVIIFHGSAARCRSLVEELRGVHGVKNVRLLFTRARM